MSCVTCHQAGGEGFLADLPSVVGDPIADVNRDRLVPIIHGGKTHELDQAISTLTPQVCVSPPRRLSAADAVNMPINPQP
jgi:hypothetical protein